MLNERGIIKPINEMSLTIDAISDKFEHTAFLCVDQEAFQQKEVAQLVETLVYGSNTV